MTKLFIALKGSPIAFKVENHKMDPNQLVLKARHPEVGSLIALAAGLTENLPTTKGSSYFITFVPRDAFEAGFGKAMLNIMAGNLALTAQEIVPVYSDLDAVSDASDDDEEEDDGDEEDEEDAYN